MNNLRLDWCTHEAAKYAVMNWHYSRRMPAGKLVRIGVWESGKFIGAILFGSGVCNDLGKSYGLQNNETCELVRIALTRHSAPVTRMMAIAIKMLKRQAPGLRLIVSFADPEQGHNGGIYRGGNWRYLGRSNPAQEYWVNGKKWHGRALRMSREGADGSFIYKGIAAMLDDRAIPFVPDPDPDD